jgi:radical SAM superfamily enzyme
MLEYLGEKLPGISRITTYARSQTCARKSVDELKRIRAAGLNRVHVGLESGSDRVLKYMKKGVTAEGHIRGGRNVVDAGMELSEYYMPGLGGKEMWQNHAVETARVLNAINPHFIRLRTLHVRDNLPLYQNVACGDFTLQTPDEIVAEIKCLIERLDGITSAVVSDHIGNMLQDVAGRLPEDKQKMIDALDRYLALGAEQRLHYQVGRMMGQYQGVRDMAVPSRRRQVEKTLNRLKESYGDDLSDRLGKIHDKLMR